MNNIEKAELEFLRQNALKLFFNTAIARREFWANKGENDKAKAVQSELDAVSSLVNFFEEKLKAQDNPPPQMVLNKFSEKCFLPNAVEVEAAVLGAILIDSQAIGIVKNANLKPAHFYLEKHAIIFSVCLDLYENKTPVDLLIVANKLKKNKQLEKIGGAYFLTTLTDRVASCANVEFHTRILQQKHINRQIITVCSEAIYEAMEDTTDCFTLQEKTILCLEDVLDFTAQTLKKNEFD